MKSQQNSSDQIRYEASICHSLKEIQEKGPAFWYPGLDIYSGF
jgi:hypothetical protein